MNKMTKMLAYTFGHGVNHVRDGDISSQILLLVWFTYQKLDILMRQWIKSVLLLKAHATAIFIVKKNLKRIMVHDGMCGVSVDA